MQNPNLQKAVDIMGSRKALADAASCFAASLNLRLHELKLTTLNSWFVKPANKSRPVRFPTSEWCIPIAMAVGWRVTPTDLRPDVYPADYCTWPEPEVGPKERREQDGNVLAAASD